jgi:hypothetical protein
MNTTSRLVTAVLVCCGTLAVVAAPGANPDDQTTGQRRLWREIALDDPAGFNRSVSNVLVGPNGSYCYSYFQGLSELYVVEGLR